jgi:hypothetical protein
MVKSVSYESSSGKIEGEVDKPPEDFSGKFFEPLVHLLNILLLIVKTHVLVAALLFPTDWAKKEVDPDELAALYRIWCLSLAGILLLLHILAVVALLTRFQLLDFAKVFFIAVAWLVTIVSLIVVNQQKNINALLFAIEDEAGHVRDESVMLIRAGQAGIRSLNKKVYGEDAPNQFLTASELFKSIGPLALMFLKHETSIFRWAPAGLSLAAKGLRFAQSLLSKK